METMELVQTREHAKTKCSVPVQQVLHESVGGRLRADSCENDRDLPAHSNGHRRDGQVVAQVTDNRVTQPSEWPLAPPQHPRPRSTGRVASQIHPAAFPTGEPPRVACACPPGRFLPPCW